jgi:hypothetical protein
VPDDDVLRIVQSFGGLWGDGCQRPGYLGEAELLESSCRLTVTRDQLREGATTTDISTDAVYCQPCRDVLTKRRSLATSDSKASPTLVPLTSSGRCNLGPCSGLARSPAE